MEKFVVVTGAASGIGRSLVSEYLGKGLKVAALDRDEPALQALVAERSNTDLIVANADVTEREELLELAAKLAQDHGAPDIWINNAGITTLGAFEKVSPEDFDRVLAVNFTGLVNGTRAALSVMQRPRKGKIVNVASVSGVVPAPYMTAYTASKHAVVGFTRALREEHEQRHSPIEVLLVLPGFAKTKIMESREGFEFPKWLEWMIDSSQNVAHEIVEGVAASRKEIIPTFNGRMMLKAHRLLPDLTTRSSRILVARNWKELLGLHPIEK